MIKLHASYGLTYAFIPKTRIEPDGEPTARSAFAIEKSKKFYVKSTGNILTKGIEIHWCSFTGRYRSTEHV